MDVVWEEQRNRLPYHEEGDDPTQRFAPAPMFKNAG